MHKSDLGREYERQLCKSETQTQARVTETQGTDGNTPTVIRQETPSTYSTDYLHSAAHVLISLKLQ